MAMEGILALVLVFLLVPVSENLQLLTTADRIRAHGYPVETHTVTTKDGYILTMYRIPHHLTERPVVFLQHGLTSSSDCWILNGPGVALAYMLVEAGYDVWFWNFEWHQIAIYDMPAMFDYVLQETNQRSLHYVGHSQGTTVFVVLTSMIPKYNEIFKSAHLLAPVVYMDNIRGPMVDIAAPLLGLPNAFVEVFGSMELAPNNKLMRLIKELACKNDTASQTFCSHFMFSVFGWNKESLDMSIFNDIVTTHPAGASVNQLIHYMQEKLSKKFRRFDYGVLRNLRVYGKTRPPMYDLKKVTAPIWIYYGSNDYLSDTTDVYKLMKELPHVMYAFKAPDPKWNHLDHLWSKNVKEVINDKILMYIKELEGDPPTIPLM